MTAYCLEVRGQFACFTRPEMKVERVSYDFITPSAARAIFESILWKPAIRWRIETIEVLNPVRWISVRRNEVGAVVSTRNILAAMDGNPSPLGLAIEDERQQRAGLFLRDVAYRLHAEFELSNPGPDDSRAKFDEMFQRRALKGQCVNQPYLGCREFAASFRLVTQAETEPPACVDVDGDFGWMLHDLDFSDRANPQAAFFRAHVRRGVLDLRFAEVRR